MLPSCGAHDLALELKDLLGIKRVTNRFVVKTPLDALVGIFLTSL